MFEHLPGDERGGGLDDGEPVVGVSLPAGGDAAPVAQPAVGAFDRPTMSAERVARLQTLAIAADNGADDELGRRQFAFAAARADHRLELAQPQLRTQLAAVVAAVGPQLARADATGEQFVDKRQQLPAFVLVAGPDSERERDPSGVDDQVETAAWAAAERATDLAAPFFVSTSDASTIARDQSLKPSCSNSSCTRASNRSQTPARRHS